MRPVLSIFALALILFSANGSAKSDATPRLNFKFDFGPGVVASGYKQVVSTDLYDKAKGYGFEPDSKVTCLDRLSSRSDRLKSDFCTSDKPFHFSVALPEGNYQVRVTFGDAEAGTQTTVKAELRRLMLERVHTRPGEFVTHTFAVNIRTPNIAGGGEVKLKDREKSTEAWAWDEKLTLEFNDEHPVVNAIEITRDDQIPTLYLLGDSTVCDQPGEPYASWGQMLPRFFDSQVVIANNAESGESLRSSLAARRLDKVLSTMKAGDYLFIQYGHNDEKERGEGVGPFTTYKQDLKRFVEATRQHGGLPVLLTPVQRRTFDSQGKITNSHGDYPEAVRQVAKEQDVPLIDLNVMSKILYEALGPEKSLLAFKSGDGTHHNNYGSYELAKCVVEGIRSLKLGVGRYLLNDTKSFSPERPDAVESFSIPPSPDVSQVKPLGS